MWQEIRIGCRNVQITEKHQQKGGGAVTDIPRHRLGEVERKVLTLYSLHTLGECGNLQLISFMVENDIMNYFDLQTALGDLRDAGQAARTPVEADYLYQLTPAGEEALRMFLPRAPASLLKRVEEAAPSFRERFDREREMPARIVHDEGNEYHVSMQIVERRMPLMSIDVSLPTAELAARFRDRWVGVAQDIYEYIIGRLAGEEEGQ